MQKKSNIIFLILIIIGDALSIFLSFVFAYYIRTRLDTRPYFFDEKPIDFLTTFVFLIPIWIILITALGLYRKNIVFGRTSRSREIFRLFFCSILGTLSIIAIGYFKQENLFPVRLVAIYSTVLCFLFLLIFRSIFRLVRKLILKQGKNASMRAIIIGNDANTSHLVEYITKNPDCGYRISAIVSNKHYIPKHASDLQSSSLREALKSRKIDVIFQTDAHQTEYVYKQSLNYHIPYYFVPGEAALSSQLGDNNCTVFCIIAHRK